MGLGGSVIDSDTFNNARNYPANDLESLLIASLLEAHSCTPLHFHLDKHDWHVWLLQLVHWGAAVTTIEHFAFHHISHVFEAKVDFELFFPSILWQQRIERLMGMLHVLDHAAFFANQIDGLLAQQKEVHLDDFEDFPHGDHYISHQFFHILRLQNQAHGLSVQDEVVDHELRNSRFL